MREGRELLNVIYVICSLPAHGARMVISGSDSFFLSLREISYAPDLLRWMFSAAISPSNSQVMTLLVSWLLSYPRTIFSQSPPPYLFFLRDLTPRFLYVFAFNCLATAFFGLNPWPHLPPCLPRHRPFLAVDRRRFPRPVPPLPAFRAKGGTSFLPGIITPYSVSHQEVRAQSPSTQT